MIRVGIRELKDNLSAYVRRVEAGERLEITAHGRPVAEMAPLEAKRKPRSRWDEMVAAGMIELPRRKGSGMAHWPKLELPAGTAAALIDEDRGE